MEKRESTKCNFRGGNYIYDEHWKALLKTFPCTYTRKHCMLTYVSRIKVTVQKRKDNWFDIQMIIHIKNVCIWHFISIFFYEIIYTLLRRYNNILPWNWYKFNNRSFLVFNLKLFQEWRNMTLKYLLLNRYDIFIYVKNKWNFKYFNIEFLCKT